MEEKERVRKRLTRRERFLKVASRRTTRLLKDIQRLGKCGNRAAYEYTDADIEKIFSSIEREMDLMKARFQERREVEFSFD